MIMTWDAIEYDHHTRYYFVDDDLFSLPYLNVTTMMTLRFHNTRYYYDDDDLISVMTFMMILWLSSYMMTSSLSLYLVLMISSLLPYLIWLCWWYDCHHTWYDYVDGMTVILLDVTLVMMIFSLLPYLIWVRWWSHHCHYSWYDFDDDIIKVISSMMRVMRST